MKKILLLLLLSQQLITNAQNVGIGTTNPTRAKLEVHGAVDVTSAIFGGDGNGVSLQRNWPGIGFNQYYNGGSRYIGSGYAAVQFIDPGTGYMAIDLFGPGSANGFASSSRRALVISNLGRVNIGGAALPNANLNVSRGDPANIHYATAAFEGTKHHSFFNYSWEENTYIRAGQDHGTVFINDIPHGKVVMSGFVGINTSSPALPLEIRQIGSQAGLALVNGNSFKNWRFSVEGTTGVLHFAYDGVNVGRFDTDGDYIVTSDSRLKTKVQALPSLLGKVMQLQPVNYEMIHNNPTHKQSIGFLAQDVKTIFPELVSVVIDSASGYKDITDVHMLNYDGFSVLAIKAIQEQQAMIDKQQKAIQAMQKEIGELKQTVAELLRSRNH